MTITSFYSSSLHNAFIFWLLIVISGISASQLQAARRYHCAWDLSPCLQGHMPSQ
jgi:hypothetical protein